MPGDVTAIVSAVDGIADSPDASSLASPKSRIFARPSCVMKMFSGFRSRWMMPL